MRRGLLAAFVGLAVATPAAADGVLKIAIGANLNTLDPARTTLGEEYNYDVLVFNGLTRMTPEMKTEPDLAASWEASEDLKAWTFHLRKGVKFHNGRELAADDVVKSFERVLDPATGSSARSNFTMIEKVTAVDPLTVRFDLSYGYSGFADILTDRQVKIVPADHIADLPTAPIGTGPFKFVSYTPGDRLVLARNPDYFEPGLPKLQGVEERIIPDMTVRIAALEAGDIDYVWDLPPEQVDKLKANPKLKVQNAPAASWDGAILNNEIPPFNDVRVRKALHLAISKPDLVKIVLFGYGQPTHSPVLPTDPAFDKSIPITKADPAAARKLLAEAGYPQGVKVPMVLPVGRPVRERLGITIAQLAKPAGFDFDLQRVPYARFTAEISGKAPMYIDGFFQRPNLDTATYPLYYSTGSWNERLWHFKDAKVDELLDKARVTADPEQQKALYMTFQREVAEQVPSYMAYAADFIVAYRADLKDHMVHPMRWVDLRTAYLSN
jgi:peptide/nickel transport system substrate-binding protein